jgi:hypothetical protein
MVISLCGSVFQVTFVVNSKSSKKMSNRILSLQPQRLVILIINSSQNHQWEIQENALQNALYNALSNVRITAA